MQSVVYGVESRAKAFGRRSPQMVRDAELTERVQGVDGVACVSAASVSIKSHEELQT